MQLQFYQLLLPYCGSTWRYSLTRASKASPLALFERPSIRRQKPSQSLTPRTIEYRLGTVRRSQLCEGRGGAAIRCGSLNGVDLNLRNLLCVLSELTGCPGVLFESELPLIEHVQALHKSVYGAFRGRRFGFADNAD